MHPEGIKIAIFGLGYPGPTDEICIPVLEHSNSHTFNTDFTAGYSPERINAGDKRRGLPAIPVVTFGTTLVDGTTWNILPFKPRLVGGQFIGVNPYYLLQKAQFIGDYLDILLGIRFGTAKWRFCGAPPMGRL